MFKGTIIDTNGIADEDITIHIKDFNTLTGFMSGVKNLKANPDYILYQASDGNYYVESGHLRRKAAAGLKCDPFVHRIQVGYMGSKAGAELEDIKFRNFCEIFNVPEVMQIRFEIQETK
jgi:hypothetical protein